MVHRMMEYLKQKEGIFAYRFKMGNKEVGRRPHRYYSCMGGAGCLLADQRCYGITHEAVRRGYLQ